MKIHFTNLFGQSSKSVALMAQNDIMNVVRELGVNELGIYFYDHSNEPASELNSRMDGILAGVAFGDIVFVQWSCLSMMSHHSCLRAIII